MQVFQLDLEPGHPPRFLQFDPTGRFLVAGWRPTFLIDTNAGGPPTRALSGYPGGSLAFARGGQRLAFVGTSVGFLAWYDLTTGGGFDRKFDGIWIRSLVVHPDGETVFVSVGGYGLQTEGEVRVLRLDDFEERAVIRTDAGNVGALALSADGNWLAGASGVFVRVWSVGVGRFAARARRRVEPDGYFSGFALSPDGSTLAVASSRGFAAWDVASGAQLFKSGKHRRALVEVACAPDRPLFATGDNAGGVFLWDATGRVLNKYDWGLGCVAKLAFAPDGLRCAAMDVSGKVVVWDVDE